MTRIRTLACTLAVVCCVPWSAAAADLETAIALYASALYEEALSEMDAAADQSNADLVDQYRALCFLALNRQDDAEEALERIVLRNPLYEVDAATVSPKLVDVFTQVRTRALPVAARRRYADAKSQYDLGRFVEARRRFVALLDILERTRDLDTGEAVADLAQLGEGFLQLAELELARAAEPPSVLTTDAALPPAEPVAAPRSAPLPGAGVSPAAERAVDSAPPGSAGAASEPVVMLSRVYSSADTGIVPPVALERDLPRWAPGPGERREVRGTVEIVVTEDGVVESVAIATPTTPAYDRALQDAARDWRFSPATREGTPVKFRLILNLVLSPPPTR